MKLIIGLGNPGVAYEKTRHNLGSQALRAIVKEYKAILRLNRSLKSRVAKVTIMGNECLLAIPNTFMNLSGEAVRLLLGLEEITSKDLLVIHDDIDLELGVIRFKKKGSSGGHKGIGSIIKELNSQDFCRLKLGIGRSFCKRDARDYVLSNFRRKELKVINPFMQNVVKACEVWIKLGIDRAMSEFNQIKPKFMERSEHKFEG